MNTNLYKKYTNFTKIKVDVYRKTTYSLAANCTYGLSSSHFICEGDGETKPFPFDTKLLLSHPLSSIGT